NLGHQRDVLIKVECERLFEEKKAGKARTVLRAYHAAGRPGQLPRLASYEQWSDTVRSTLVWLGHEDPAKTMDTAREGDPEALAVREFYAHWQEVLTLNTGYTAVALI
ncbi:hypothetical protein MAQ58_23445, partial [Enterobacter sp. DRP3]|nr:hypothetical protein [Enterobacter sp. DRP3]